MLVVSWKYALPRKDNSRYEIKAPTRWHCHPPSASLCSVLTGQWSARIFTHDKYNILSDILTEFEAYPVIIIEKYAKT